jgi:flavin-dependent dehydrogenase
MITDRSDYDVVVMGGGLAGLSFARQLLLRRPGTTVLVVERMTHPVPVAAHKVGEALVEMSAHYFAEVLKLREHMDSSQIRKMGLRFFPSAQVPPPPLSRRAESGPSDFLPARTYQTDRGIFENALGKMIVADGAEFRHGCRVEGVELDAAGAHTVTISRDQERCAVRARWVVDASGRRGILKNKLGLRQDVSHDCNAVWLRLGEMIWMDRLIEDQEPPPSDAAVAGWTARVPNGQRWRSTNHLMGCGYWAWLIPLASGSISVGVVADPKHVPFEAINGFDALLSWLAVHEPELARAVQARRDKLQDFHMLKHYAHGCKQVFSPDRWAITGEAGVFTDPLYSPGGDFISIANTFITNMVVADLDGEPVEELVTRSNLFYLTLFQSVLPVWENQYGLMGHPQVWSAKSVWDPFLYFAVFGILHHNGGLTDVGFMGTVGEDFARVVALNHRMQAFFREWAAAEPAVDADHFVDHTGNVKLITTFEKVLFHRLTPDALRSRLKENVRFVEDVMRVIMAGAACRTGHVTDPVTVDPLTFTIGSEPAAGRASGAGRERSIAWAGELLAGLWHGRAAQTRGAVGPGGVGTPAAVNRRAARAA